MIKNVFVKLISRISLQKARKSDAQCYLGIAESNKAAWKLASL